MRVALFDRGPELNSYLLIVIHHLVVDGVSWRILLEDFQKLYQQLSAGEKPSLPAKTSTYSTSQGKLTEAELNAAAKGFSSPLLQAPWRYFDAYTIKYHHSDPEVDAMYRHTQERSRNLADRGSGIVRADIDAARRAAGESPWTALEPDLEVVA